MVKLYYGNGICSIEGHDSVRGVEINFNGTIDARKTSVGDIAVSKNKILIISLDGRNLKELFTYVGDLKIISAIVADSNGESVPTSIKRVMDYSELLNSNSEDMTTVSEGMSAGYRHKQKMNKTRIVPAHIMATRSDDGRDWDPDSEYCPIGEIWIHEEGTPDEGHCLPGLFILPYIYPSDKWCDFYFLNVFINGVPVQPGDYVGAFTPNGICVGYKKWDTSMCEGGICSIRIYGKNYFVPNSGPNEGELVYQPGTENYMDEGEIPTFRIYNSSSQWIDVEEWSGLQYLDAYPQPPEESFGSGTLTWNDQSDWNFDELPENWAYSKYNPYLQATTEEIGEDVTTLSIGIQKGWNWISINVYMETPDINHILQTGVNGFVHGDMVRDPVNNLSAQYYYTEGAGAGMWLGGLTQLEPGVFYEIYTSQDANAGEIQFMLNITGLPINPYDFPLTITGDYLEPGQQQDESQHYWNYIAYTPQYAMDTNQALASLDGNGWDQPSDLIKGQLASSQYYGNMLHLIWEWDNLTQSTVSKSWVGTLTHLEPGKGYMIRRKNDGILTYPSPFGGEVITKTPAKPGTEQFIEEPPEN